MNASPTWYKPRLLLTRLYQSLGRPQSTAQMYQELGQLYPHHPVGPLGLAQLALQRHDRLAASAQLSEALRRDPTSVQALLMKQYLAAEENDRRQQITLLNRVLAADPTNADVHRQLGKVYESEQRWHDALRSYGTAQRLHPDPDVADHMQHIRQQIEKAE